MDFSCQLSSRPAIHSLLSIFSSFLPLIILFHGMLSSLFMINTNRPGRRNLHDLSNGVMLSLFRAPSRHHTSNRQHRSHADPRAVTRQRNNGLDCRSALYTNTSFCASIKASHGSPREFLLLAT